MLSPRNLSRKQARTGRAARFPVAITILVLLVVVLVILFGKDDENHQLVNDMENPDWKSFDSWVQMNASFVLANGTDLVWQIPSSPKAVLFLAHGCGGRALNFWDRSPNCPVCVGLPEERLILLHALARKFAVVAIQSRGVCWSTGDEVLFVREILRRWISEKNLENLPVFAMGASSGGYFVSALAVEFRFRAIALMIAEGVYSRLNISRDYPPTIFAHMPKDQPRKRMILGYKALFRDRGIDVDEIECREFPLTPEIFAQKIPSIDHNLSAKLFEVFKENGFVDERGFMRNDGRETPWKAALKERHVVLPDESLYDHVQEVMNVAFGYHEMTSFPSGRIFHWFESHMN